MPRVAGWYKHLGVRAETQVGWEAARAAVVARCCGMAGALARLGILSAAEYVDTVDVACNTVVAYFGACFPLGWRAAAAIDVAKRRGLARLGDTGWQASSRAALSVHISKPRRGS